MDISRYSKDVLNIGVVVVALIVASNIYKAQNKSIEMLRGQIDTEIQKNAVVGEISQLEKSFDSYKTIFSPKDSSAVISYISKIADKNGVKVVSIVPQPVVDYPIYVKNSFNVNLVVSSYHAVGKFVGDIEKRGDSYIVIDSIKIKTKIDDKAVDAEGQEAIRVNLQLSSVAFKK